MLLVVFQLNHDVIELAVKTVKCDWCVSIRLLYIVSKISRFVCCLSVLLLSSISRLEDAGSC